MEASSHIKFTNLLDEAKYAVLAGDLRKAEALLAEARVLVTYERRIVEDLAS